jgi:hypothetical protein
MKPEPLTVSAAPRIPVGGRVATEVLSLKRLEAHDASAESMSEGAGLPRQPTKKPDGPLFKG